MKRNQTKLRKECQPVIFHLICIAFMHLSSLPLSPLVSFSYWGVDVAYQSIQKARAITSQYIHWWDSFSYLPLDCRQHTFEPPWWLQFGLIAYHEPGRHPRTHHWQEKEQKRGFSVLDSLFMFRPFFDHTTYSPSFLMISYRSRLG
jgi:hypothetical protein